ncbi:hypothetical protein PENSTE_c009G01155 [Penicillium steckii]|uniref:Acyl-CoA thioesterase II n=1 Tax=Penicillium steckii TaxID=303698 RepID=A0A1V6T9Z3_9EURO|nr:hypothetical protein PENSTE_c009G01155 [Penicillium steckii]
MPSLKEQIAVQQISKDCYESVVPPIRMGDLADWAYGGNILAIAVSAAYATVTKGHHLYSINGYFVRPASRFEKLICRVERIRDTRTFITRHLRVYQGQGDAEQLCLIATADFHVDEPVDMVKYSAHPQVHIPIFSAEESPKERTQEQGLYRILDKFLEVYPHSPARDEKDVSAIVSADRFRVNEPPYTEADRIAALAFYMDRGLAYIPANHSGYTLDMASACATLDFSLRFLTHEINLRDWNVSERQTCGARNARAFSEGRVFNAEGELLASMTQKTILRPKIGGSRI